MKKRILFVGEASFLNTGFSNIYRSLLPRLVETGKYEIAELGSYAPIIHPDVQNFINGRWKFYAGMPSNHKEGEIFNRFVQCARPRTKMQNTAQFGEWCFNDVIADFKPDFVVDIRDWWMLEYQEVSPFREWFKWIIMPTVDSPQQDEIWIQTYENANLCLAYSDFGVHTLKIQSPSIKIFPKPMRPGVDMDIFKKLDRGAIREKFNLSKTIPIIGIVQRNQSRKNILETIDAFALMKNKCKGEKNVDESVLLIHSAWPDNMHSFNYPRHIWRLNSSKWIKYNSPNIMHSILQTLICHNCNQSSVCFAVNLFNKNVSKMVINGKEIAGIFMPCCYCGKNTATCPTTAIGHTREQLAEIYNLMDVLVQSSIAEGDGMPSTEAKACHVPVIVTDHSATAEKGRFPSEYSHIKSQNIVEANYSVNKGGITHAVAGYRHEPETGCLRAVPDISDLCNKMKLLISDEQLRDKMSVEARECVIENYDWDKMAKQWEYVFDNIKPLDRSTTWDSSINVVEDVKQTEVPQNLTDEQYVEFLYINILKYPTVDFVGAKMWIDHLKQGITREQLMQQFIAIGNQQISGSRARDMIRQSASGKTTNTKTQEFV